MAGQGATTRAVAKVLSDKDWNVVYKCVPNTPHTGVVPIPTPNGTSNQRYPDILAYRNLITKLVEIEITLNEATSLDIIKRFREMVDALRDTRAWSSWRSKIQTDTGHTLPDLFVPQCELVLCNRVTGANRLYIEDLKQNSIAVYEINSYKE